MQHIHTSQLQMHTFRIFISSLLIAGLAGCATPGKPTASKLTSKTPQEYAACVLPKWQAVAPQATQKSIAHGYRFLRGCGPASHAEIDCPRLSADGIQCRGQ